MGLKEGSFIMNKIKTAIAVSFIGIAMAIGVGASIRNSKEAIPAHAADNAYVYTISDESWGTTVSPSNSIGWDSIGNFDTKNSNGAAVSENHVATGVSKAAFSNVKSITLSGKTNSSSTGKMAVYTSTTANGTYSIVGSEKSYSASKTIKAGPQHPHSSACQGMITTHLCILYCYNMEL